MLNIKTLIGLVVFLCEGELGEDIDNLDKGTHHQTDFLYVWTKGEHATLGHACHGGFREVVICSGSFSGL